MLKFKLYMLSELGIIELIFILIWWYMYYPFLINHIILFGDLGLPDLNSNLISQFFNVNPNYSNIMFIFIFHYDQNILPKLWDNYLLIVPFVTPLGFFYLMYTMNFKRYTRMITTLFYSINPLVILFGISAFEYTSIFLIFPIILAFMIRYHKNNNTSDLINSAITIFLLLFFFGTDYLKFIIFIIFGIIILDILFSGKKLLLKKFKNYVLWLVLTVVLSLPLLISLIESLNIFHHAAVIDAPTISSLIGITKFEYASSNFEVSLYALPYVANQLTYLKYESTWFGALYLFLILFSLASILKCRGEYRKIYYTLFLILSILILFQFGIYNGTFIYLFQIIPDLDIYNYPLFLYITQALIYAIFFAMSYEFINKYLINKFKKAKNVILPLLAIVFLVLLLFSSMPVIDYEHSTNASFALSNEVPDYVLNLTNTLKPYSNSRVMFLPDNTSSLNYAYTGVSYYDVYGFPYGYQNFLSLFPNLTLYKEIAEAFVNGNSLLVGKLLESQDINAIVVLHPLSNYSIISSGTAINGGGIQFNSILNKTGDYTLKIYNNNYALYVFSPVNSLGCIKGVLPNSLNNISYKQVSNDNIVTSDLSYISYSINIHFPTQNYSYSPDQYMAINRNNLTAINRNFSNIQFYSSNNNPLYSWISSLDRNIASIYIRIHHQVNQTIYLRVYPDNVNFLSDNGYLGEAPELSGLGSNILPKSILYSTVFIGVYGCGYDGNVFTYNISFNPLDFRNVENSNLSNVAFYTYNGELLNAHLHGTVSNISTSATVTISFPDGVPYFQRLKTSNGAGYDEFYMGFTSKNTDLNALHSIITYNVNSSKTAINIGYLPHDVKDFGSYNEYDNGKYVFPYFNDYLNESFGSPWQFDIPVGGYGFVSNQVYTPLSYSYFYLTQLHSGQEAITYSDILGGLGVSPLYVSNNTDSALMGATYAPSIAGGGINQEIQQHSTDIGFDSNTSYIGIYKDYNVSTNYVYNTLYSANETNTFTFYGMFYDNGELHFYLNTTNVFDYGSGLTNLMYSDVNSGEMDTYYTSLINESKGNISFGKSAVYQAIYNGIQIQDPAYINNTIIFSIFNGNNSNIQWKVGNYTIIGKMLKYKFLSSGKYTITAFFHNKTYKITETILPLKKESSLNMLVFENTGYHIIKTNFVSNATYVWYINGQIMGKNSPELNYNFNYNGDYSIKVYVVNSYGNYSLSFIINIKNKPTFTLNDVFMVIYNTVLPVIFIIYLASKRFRLLVNIKMAHLLKYFNTYLRFNH